MQDVIKNPRSDIVSVIPLEPGSGKSTMANEALADLTKNDLRNSGTILLKQLTKDCDQAANDINKLAGKEVARPYHGKMFYRNNKKSYAKESDYLISLQEFPILVMTHSMFITRHKKLDRFLYWLDPEVVINTDAVKAIKDHEVFNNDMKFLVRERLIIDEQPQPLQIYEITMQKISALESFIQRSGNVKYQDEIYNATDYIKQYCFLKRSDLVVQFWDDRYKLDFSNDLIKYINDHGTVFISKDETIFDVFVGLGLFCKDGGFVSYSDNDRNKHVMVASYIDIFDPLFKTIILDGTAWINDIYLKNPDKYYIVPMSPTKSYENTTLDISEQYAGTKSELLWNKNLIPQLHKFIIEKSKGHKALIITKKEFEEEFKKLKLPKNIVIDHYGKITGTNDYIECDYLFIVGLNFLTDDVYKVYWYKYFDSNANMRDLGTKNVKGVHKFSDAAVQSLKISLVTCDLVQAANRGTCRINENGNTPKTYIFMLNKDPDITALVKKAMPGISITSNTEFFESMPLEAKRPMKQSPVEVLIDLLNRRNEYFGDKKKVNKSVILDSDECLRKLKSSRRTDLWNSSEIKQLENEGKIKIWHREVEFFK